jgi:hypothetical protein
MAAEPKSLLVLVCCVLALVGSVVYSIGHPETGDDIYETRPL